MGVVRDLATHRHCRIAVLPPQMRIVFQQLRLQLRLQIVHQIRLVRVTRHLHTDCVAGKLDQRRQLALQRHLFLCRSETLTDNGHCHQDRHCYYCDSPCCRGPDSAHVHFLTPSDVRHPDLTRAYCSRCLWSCSSFLCCCYCSWLCSPVRPSAPANSHSYASCVAPPHRAREGNIIAITPHPMAPNSLRPGNFHFRPARSCPLWTRRFRNCCVAGAGLTPSHR